MKRRCKSGKKEERNIGRTNGRQEGRRLEARTGTDEMIKAAGNE